MLLSRFFFNLLATHVFVLREIEQAAAYHKSSDAATVYQLLLTLQAHFRRHIVSLIIVRRMTEL